MKIITTFFAQRFRWFGKTETPESKRERFITNVVRTQAFLKLTTQDKLLSLGRMIELFRKDNGYTPAQLDKKLESLNEKVKRESTRTWMSLYPRSLNRI